MPRRTRYAIQPPEGAPIDLSHPQARGLVALWMLNETGGTTAYDATGRYHGTYSSSGATFPTPVISEQGIVRDYDESLSQYVNAGTIDITGWNALSLSAWFRADQVSHFRRIVSITYSGGDDIRLWLSTNNLNGDFDDTTAAGVSASFSDTTLWHHTALTYDAAGNIALWLDGARVGTAGPDSFNFAGASGVTSIGSVEGPGAATTCFNGLLANIRLYDRGLFADEVRDLYVNPYAIFDRRHRAGLVPVAGGVQIETLIPTYRRHHLG